MPAWPSTGRLWSAWASSPVPPKAGASADFGTSFSHHERPLISSSLASISWNLMSGLWRTPGFVVIGQLTVWVVHLQRVSGQRTAVEQYEIHPAWMQDRRKQYSGGTCIERQIAKDPTRRLDTVIECEPAPIACVVGP